jgi:CP family cyanate transporter-like MFS transporter
VTPRDRTRLAIALLLCAVAARPLAVSVGPILPDIQADLAMSPFVSGVLGMVPVICLGLFAPVGARLASVLRPRTALGIALALIVAFGAARAVAPTTVTLITLTIGLGIGMGMSGSIPSMIIKARAPRAPAFMTGMYGTGVVSGAAVASLLVIPFVGIGGDWRAAILLLSLPVLVAALVGFWLLGPDTARPLGQRTHAAVTWSDPTAWLIAAIFGLQSLIYWSLVIWLADVLVAVGWSGADAGTMVGIFQTSNLVAVVGVGHLAERYGTRRSQLRVVAALFTLGLLGLAIVPQLTVAWIIVAGAGLGAAFPLALTLPVDYASDDREAGGKASLMLLVGYLVAAVGPPALGLVREATTASAPAFLLLAACGAGFLALSAWLRPPSGRGHQVPITTD